MEDIEKLKTEKDLLLKLIGERQVNINALEESNTYDIKRIKQIDYLLRSKGC